MAGGSDGKGGVEAASMFEMTAEIVGTYVAHNSLPAAELPGLISAVHATLASILSPPAPAPARRPEPAVSVRRSVTNDHIVCLEDGKRFKSLRRHLQSAYGMTPADYRAKWGLPHDYPMVAPAYAAARSDLAKSMGLGRLRRPRAGGTAVSAGTPAPDAMAAEALPEAAKKPARGRTPKARAA